MALSTGSTLSFYEVLGPLGSGGMGEVYLARDTRLERDVAIKVLPEELAGDEERLRRFEREAKTLASLNHPNVAGIHGIDQVGDTCFIAMELVPGEDLAARLARGPLPLRDAIDVCRQIAEGLEAAHEAGVVHRDLKPANVRITPEGGVKVLDFGLAKPMTGQGTGGSGTSVTARPDSFLVTEEGLMLGTPTYMSPEQARARPVDRRTDIWAFGCVLYECLTGKRAFQGESLTDILAAIVDREPDWTRLPADTPPAVVELIERCVIKDPFRRLRDLGEARLLLADPALGERQPGAQAGSSAKWPVAAVVVLGLLAVAWIFRPRAAWQPPPALSLSVSLAPEEELPESDVPELALSRDGSLLVWVGGPDRRLHVRALDSYEVTVLPGTEGASCPFFSPNGLWIGYFDTDRLMKVDVSGQDPVELVAEARHSALFNSYVTPNRGAAWGDDGRIVFSPSTIDRFFVVGENGGPVEALTLLDDTVNERTHRFPQVLPRRDAIVFAVDDYSSPEHYHDAGIDLFSLGSGERRRLIEGGSQPRYANGKLAFLRGGAVYVQDLDVETLTLRGDPFLALSDVEVDLSSGAAQYAVAEDGTLAYVPGEKRHKLLRFVWHETDGSITEIEIPPAAYCEPKLSPDGRRFAFSMATPTNTDLWIHDFTRGTTTQLTTGGSSIAALWSPDSESVVFESRQPKGIYRKRIGGTDASQVLLETDDFARPCFFTPDGAGLVFTWHRAVTSYDIMYLDLATGSVSEWIAGPYDEAHARLSPDGRWLAYYSNHTGVPQVYVTDAETRTERWQVSSEGGEQPLWSRDGSILYYAIPELVDLWAVDVEAGETLELGAPRLVTPGFFYDQDYPNNFDLAADGRFLSILESEEAARTPSREIRIVPGFLSSSLSRGDR